MDICIACLLAYLLDNNLRHHRQDQVNRDWIISRVNQRVIDVDHLDSCVRKSKLIVWVDPELWFQLMRLFITVLTLYHSESSWDKRIGRNWTEESVCLNVLRFLWSIVLCAEIRFNKVYFLGMLVWVVNKFKRLMGHLIHELADFGLVWRGQDRRRIRTCNWRLRVESHRIRKFTRVIEGIWSLKVILLSLPHLIHFLKVLQVVLFKEIAGKLDKINNWGDNEANVLLTLWSKFDLDLKPIKSIDKLRVDWRGYVMYVVYKLLV